MLFRSEDLAPKRVSTGTGNDYLVTASSPGASYRDGEIVTFLPDRSSSGAPLRINVNGRGLKPWRPAPSVEFPANTISANVPVVAYYRLASDEWLSPGTGYYVQQLASGVALQSITARLPQIGDAVISYAPSPGPGRIRLKETAQQYLKSDWPELDAYLSSLSYPWGSTTTQFTLPPAAGYFLRFAPTSTAIDPSGARLAGITQQDAFAQHTHAATVNDPGHGHSTNAGKSAGWISGTVSGAASNLIQITDGNSAAATPTSTGISVTVGNSTAAGTETRAKNVAYHLDIVASSALSAAQIACFGYPYQWDTGIDNSNPGGGRVRGNNATLASITALYVANTDGLGVTVAPLLTGLTIGSIVNLSRVGAQANRIACAVAGAPIARTGYVEIPVSTSIASGAIANSAQLAVEFGPTGPTGVAGPAGSDGGIKFAFDATTTMAAPAAGGLRFNNATIGSEIGRAHV